MIKKTNPLMSIVLLNHNGGKYLTKTIPPLLNLEYPRYEIVVVDNGSSDNSLRILRNFRSKKLKVCEQPINLGAGEGRNVGVKESLGEYVLLLDCDILINNNFSLKKLLSLYSKGDKTGFLQVPLINFKENQTSYYGVYFSLYGVNMHRKKINLSQILHYPKDLIEIGGPTAGCMFTKKKIWFELGGMDQSQKFYLDDVDIGPRANIYGYKNYLITNFYFTHMGINKAKSAKDYASRFQYYFSGNARSMLKNYKFKNILIRFPLLCIFQFLKSIKFSILRGSPIVFAAYLKSIKIFLKNLSDTIKQRKNIQEDRKTKDDLFLKIKPPKFK